MTTEHESPPPDEPSDGMCTESRSPAARESSLVRLLEHAREQRGSPSLWDAVAARLDSEERQREVLAPMLRLLDQIRERVDDETWGLLLDFEYRCTGEIMAGVEVGLDLGYAHGRAATLIEFERAPSNEVRVLTERFTDVVGDTDADRLDVALALLATLRATVQMAHGEHPSAGAERSPALAG